MSRTEIRETIENSLKERTKLGSKKSFLTRETNAVKRRLSEIKECKNGYYLGESAMLQELECVRWIEELQTAYKKLENTNAVDVQWSKIKNQKH